MTPFEGFAEAMNQLKGEAETALLAIYETPEGCTREVARVLAKIKSACGQESSIAVFLACAQIVVTMTRERVALAVEAEQKSSGGGEAV
jgi:hypothetical protein